MGVSFKTKSTETNTSSDLSGAAFQKEQQEEKKKKKQGVNLNKCTKDMCVPCLPARAKYWLQ